MQFVVLSLGHEYQITRTVIGLDAILMMNNFIW